MNECPARQCPRLRLFLRGVALSWRRMRRNGLIVSGRWRYEGGMTGLLRRRRYQPFRQIRCRLRLRQPRECKCGCLFCSLAIAPLRRVAVADLLESRQAVEAFADEIVPAVGVWLLLAVATAHDQTLGRAGHRHVQQPAVLMLVFVERRLSRRGDGAHILIAAPRPDDAWGRDF